MFDGKPPKFHPLAQIFPLLEGPALDELARDIKANGLKFPIVEYDDQIIDGRNRYFACEKAGVQPRFVTYTGTDPLEFVISANLVRRHLNESQRAMVAARLATLPKGVHRHTSQAVPSQAEAADMLNTTRRTVQRAAVVRDRAVPGIVARVDRGDVAVSVAAQVALMPEAEQERIQDAEPNVIKGAVKRFERDKKLEALRGPIAEAAAQLDAPQQLYSVIMADPPWSFQPYSRETGMDRAADNHYPTMPTEDICALKIPAAADCVLFLWATVPMLRDAMRVMDEWGFSYKSHMVWLKGNLGTGYWFRNQHELLLVGTKGNIPAPAPGSQWNSVLSVGVGKHSAKPEKFYEIVEDMFQGVPHCELFARERRFGWASWGCELVTPAPQTVAE